MGTAGTCLASVAMTGVPARTAAASGGAHTRPMDRRGKVSFAVPPGACDCHVHVIGARSIYPMLPDRPYTPPQSDVERLRAHLAELHMSRVVLIQPSFYGTDNRCLTDALRELGGMARGIAVVDPAAPATTLAALHKQGVRGVRINLESIGVRDPAAARRLLTAFAAAVEPFGWNIQIYASLGVIASLAKEMSTLPVPVVLDHFAMAQAAAGVQQPGLDAVLGLLGSGKAYVKLSAPYRISQAAPDYADVQPIARAYIDANLDRVLWASDFPHTDRVPGVAPTDVSAFRKVDDVHVLGLLPHWARQPGEVKKILVDNPARLFGF